VGKKGERKAKLIVVDIIVIIGYRDRQRDKQQRGG
jgi:hypothetical protein